jgi:chemotaxis protein MotB
MFGSPKKDQPNESGNAVDYWLTYADLMAGMLLVFILLLSVYMLISKERLERKEKQAQRALEQYQQKKSELGRVREGLDDILGVRVELIRRLKERFASTSGEIKFDDATGAIRLGNSILFSEGSAELTKQGQETLRKYMPIYFEALFGDSTLRKYVDRISIEGHTNTNYHGSGSRADAYLFNLRLSQRRAYNAMRYVIDQGLGQEFDAKERLQASGFSFSRLVYREGPNGGRVEDEAASRRIEIRFRLKNREALDNLQKLFNKYLSEDA